LNFGFAGNLGSQAACGIYSTDNAVTQDTGTACNNDSAYYVLGTTAGGSNTEFTVSNWAATASNVELSYSDTGDGSTQFGTLFLGGDIEAKVVRTNFTGAAAPDTRTVAHGLNGAPEVIIAITNEGTSPPDDGEDIIIGFWAGGQYASNFISNPAGTTAPAGQSAQQVRDDCISGRIDTSAGVTKYTISNVDADSFDFSTDATSSTYVEFLCLRGTTAALVAKAGVYTSPTGGGNASMGLSMTAAPQVLIMLPTRCPAVNTAYTDSNAGQAGLMMACNNAGSGTQYVGVSASNEDGSTNTDCLTRGCTDTILYGYSNTSAQLYAATVNAWQADDVQLNFSVAPGTAVVIPYLAIGQGSAGGIKHRGFQDMNGNFRG
jgi:hypothetical protein